MLLMFLQFNELIRSLENYHHACSFIILLSHLIFLNIISFYFNLYKYHEFHMLVLLNIINFSLYVAFRRTKLKIHKNI